jgi:peroxiredoxin
MMGTHRIFFVGLLALAFLATACERDAAEPAASPEAAAEAAADAGDADADAASPEIAEAAVEAEAPAAEAPAHPEIGKLAPDFTLVDETGKSHTLSDYRGRTVVLEWFNIPCPYVVRHYASGTFDRTIDAAGIEDLVWLAIDTTHDNTPEDSVAWKERTERRHDYPILQDPSGEVGRTYEAKTTPHMFVIDPEGIVRYMGAIDDDPRHPRRGAPETTEQARNYVIEALVALKNGDEIETTTTRPYGCTVKYGEEGS